MLRATRENAGNTGERAVRKSQRQAPWSTETVTEEIKDLGVEGRVAFWIEAQDGAER